MTTLAVRLAVIRALEDRLKTLKTEVNGDLLEELEPGDTKAATLPDGTRLGKATKTFGRQSAVVSDEKALLEWVENNHPTEIERSVRTSYRDRLLKSAKEHGEAVDETTGEIVPGIELRHGQPYVTFRAEKDSAAEIEARWRELAPMVLELEGGNE